MLCYKLYSKVEWQQRFLSFTVGKRQRKTKKVAQKYTASRSRGPSEAMDPMQHWSSLQKSFRYW